MFSVVPPPVSVETREQVPATAQTAQVPASKTQTAQPPASEAPPPSEPRAPAATPDVKQVFIFGLFTFLLFIYFKQL